MLKGRGTAATAPSFLALAGLSACAVAQPILDIFGKTPEYFVIQKTGAFELFALCGLLLLGLPAVLYGTAAVTSLIHPRGGVLVERAAMAFLLFLFLLPAAARLLQAVDDSGRASVGSAGLLSLAFVALYRRSAGVRAFAASLSLCVLVFPAVFAYRLYDSGLLRERVGQPAQRLAGGQPRPTFVVVFDEFPLFVLLDASLDLNARRFPGFARLASIATWFRHGTTVCSWTENATPIILTGKYPDEKRRQLPSAREYPDNVFTLLSATHAVHGLEQVTHLCPDSLCGTPTSAGRRLRVLVEDIAVVYLHYVLPAPYREGLPDISRRWGGFRDEGGEQTSFAADRKGLLDKGEWGDDEWLFTKFLAEIPQKVRDYRSGGRPPLSLIHFTFPHVPYRYLPDGRKYLLNLDRRNDRGYKARWASDDQGAALLALERFMMQVGAADRMVGGLLDVLAAESVLEESVVVVTADHGSSFQAGEFSRGVSGKNHADIMAVPFFVKGPGSEGAVSERNVETVDILPTILALNGLASAGGFDGQDAFGLAPPRETKQFFPLKGGKPRLTFPPRLDLAPSVTVVGETFGHGGFDDRFYAFAVGDRDLLGKRAADLGPRIASSAEAKLENAQEYEQVSLAGGHLPVYLTGSFRPDPALVPQGARRRVAVLVNDRVVTIPESLPFRKETLSFGAVLPPSSLREGRNAIRAYILR